MTKSQLFKKAHQLTKEVKIKYPEVNYRAQFGLSLSYLQKGGEEKMVELKGTEKQVKWASEIREDMLEGVRSFEYLKTKFYGKSERGNTLLDQIESGIEKMKNETSAVWFIENRSQVHDCLIIGHDYRKQVNFTLFVESEEYKMACRRLQGAMFR